MSKQPVAPQAGGEPPSRARRANATPSQPGTGRNRNASLQTGRQAVQGLVLPSQEGGQVVQYPRRAQRGEEQPPGRGGAPQLTAGRPRPSYVPPSQRKRPATEQPPVHGPYGPYPHGGVQEEPDGALPMGSSLPIPGGAAPPHGGSTTPTGGAPPRRMSVPTAEIIERVSTPGNEDRMEPEPYPHPQTTRPSSGKKWQAGQPSPMLPPERKKKRPMAFCFTACCILFWLLVVGIGVAILVIYLLYRPQPPRLRVTTATLNAGYIDQLPPPRGGLALNSDLYVLAAIYNPNTKIDVVLRYMQLDLYFQGSLIGKQAVWPPIHERPGDSALRSVHLVASEVRMTQDDVAVWQNATVNGSLVQMHLAGRFYTQLNFGRWFPFRYWVYPTCMLWLDPPPAGALRRARCRQ